MSDQSTLKCNKNQPNQRTQRCKKEYIRLHDEEGFTPNEIAKMFDLSPTTVRKRIITELAEETGRTRQSFLSRNSSKHITHELSYAPVKPINVDDFKQSANSILVEMKRADGILCDYLVQYKDVLQEQ